MTTTMTVFGSCNMDLVAYVETAPARGETVPGREFHTVPGGKGANQAIAAARAGAHVRMIGAVGEDEFGVRIRDNLRECTIDTRGLRTRPGRSGTAHILVDDEGTNSIVAVPAANGTVEGLEPGDEELLAGSQGLLLQLETPLTGVTAAAEAAHRNRVAVMLTPAPAPPRGLPGELLAHVDLLVPNEHEAAVLTRQTDPHRALSALLEHVPEVVITLGAQGVLYGSRAGELIEVPGYPVRAVDSTAAGDTFAGVLSVARGEGLGMREALRLASGAAALSVQRSGASSSMPFRQEVTEFLAEQDGRGD